MNPSGVQATAWANITTRHLATLDIAYLQAGERGPAVVMLHGWGAFKELWWNTLRGLGRDYRCYALDLPGHGDSPLHRRDSIRELADAVGAFCDSLDLREIVLIGHSMGGAVAIALVLRRPDLVRRLVLVDAAVDAFRMPRFARTYLFPTFGWAIFRLVLFVARLFSPLGAQVPHAHRGGWVRPWLRRGAYMARADPDALYRTYRALFRARAGRRLARIHVPTLVISGQFDALVPREHSRRLARSIPQARFVEIPGALHNPMDERPQAFEQAVRAFLADGWETVADAHLFEHTPTFSTRQVTLMRLQRFLSRAAMDTETLLERLRRRRRRAGPALIVPYRGMGTPAMLHLSGRVLEDRGIKPADDADSRWTNLRANWRRFGSRELPYVRVRARFQEAVAETMTDVEGYFHLSLQPSAPLHDAPVQIVDLELPDLGVRAAGEVFVPPAGARCAIVSDIDDTVLQTYATDALKMLALTFLHNARTRLPFEGVAALYRALVAGPDGSSQNPIFYVSSSPWNLYDFLVDFLAYHGLPPGPLFLTDYGLDRDRLVRKGHRRHKLAAIARIATTYPHLRLVLIGDSGQHDPEIYLEVARTYPGRVVAIYIRHVSHERRAEEVRALSAEARRLNVPMVLAPTTDALAADAASRGLIAGPAG
ncbi:MAG: alpha/beta fold hydrolase [Oscillochloridaceae bacterium]|nr:alpha/beta fold hydrolase [Chloroflexaceae bacterium]MDW8389276.1 alpha/beta fold hydrolase [Oscillochloridaceae bacterium]